MADIDTIKQLRIYAVDTPVPLASLLRQAADSIETNAVKIERLQAIISAQKRRASDGRLEYTLNESVALAESESE